MIASLLMIIGVVGLDQLTKWLVVSNIELYEEVPFINGFICWTYTQNKGAAFGMLADSRWIYMIFSLAALGVIGYILVHDRKKLKLLTVALSFLAGGGIGNMIDRIFRFNEAGENFVVDFIKTQFVDFAIFNVADSFITVGAILLAIYVIFFEMRKPKHNKNNGQDNGDENEQGTELQGE